MCPVIGFLVGLVVEPSTDVHETKYMHAFLLGGQFNQFCKCQGGTIPVLGNVSTWYNCLLSSLGGYS